MLDLRIKIQSFFKFGFIGGLPRPLPSPAEKGDREAVDEESICNPTYWDYSYVPTTIWIDASKWLIQMHFLGFRDPKNGRIVGRSPGTLAYKCSPHPPLRGPPSPLGKARERTVKLQFEKPPRDQSPLEVIRIR